MFSSDLFIGPIAEVEFSSKSLGINELKKQLDFLNKASIRFLFSNFTTNEGINEKDLLNLVPILSALKEPDEVLKTLSQYHLKESDLEQIIQVLPNIKSFKTLVILKNLNLPEGAARDILYTLKKKPEMEKKIAEIFQNRTGLFEVPLKSNEEKGVIERQFTLDLKDTLNLALKSNYFNAIFSNNQQEKLTEIVTKLGNDLPKNDITPFLNALSKTQLSDSTIDLFINRKKIILKYPDIIWSEKLLNVLNKFSEEEVKNLATFLANNPGSVELFISIFANPSKIITTLNKKLNPIQILSLALKSEGFASLFKLNTIQILSLALKSEGFASLIKMSNEGLASDLRMLFERFIDKTDKVFEELKLLSNFINNIDIFKTISLLVYCADKYSFFSISLLSKFKQPSKVIDILSNLDREGRDAIINTFRDHNIKNITTISHLEDQLIYHFSFSNKPYGLKFESPAGPKKLQLTRLDSFLLASNSPFLDRLLEKKNFDFSEPIKITDKATIEECLLYLKNPSLTLSIEDAGEFYCRIKPLDISVLEKQAVSVVKNYLKSPEITIDDYAEFQQFCMGHPFHHFSNMFASLIWPKISKVKTLKEFEYLLTIGRDCLTYISFPENGEDDWVSKLETLPFLTSLNFLKSKITPTGFKDLSRLIKLEDLNITEIDLSNKLDFLLSLGRLKKLIIRCSDLKRNDMFYISLLKNLKDLHLTTDLLANNHLYLLKNLNKLELLVLNNTSLRDEHLTFLAHLKNLISLQLIGPNIEGLCLKQVTKNLNLLTLSCKNLINLENFPKATYIALNCEILNNKELSKISESPNLKELELQNCVNISDEGLKNFENLTSLRSFTIEGSKKVSGEGLVYLYNLRNLNTLEVKNCSLTNQAIMKIPLFPNLRALDLSDNSDLGEVGKDYLKTMYPEAKLNYPSQEEIAELD